MQPKRNYALDQIIKRIEIYGLVFAILGVLIGYSVAKGWYAFIVIFSLTFVCGSFILFDRLIDSAFNFSQGIRGEIKVAAMLAQLPASDYWVAHDLVHPGVKGNLDHVVVGRNRIWAIETKHWSIGSIRSVDGELAISGYSSERVHSAMKSVKSRSASLSSYLRSENISVPWVQPVLVISTNQAMVDVPGRHDDVLVTGFRDLVARIETDAGRDIAFTSRGDILRVLDRLQSDD